MVTIIPLSYIICTIIFVYFSYRIIILKRKIKELENDNNEKELEIIVQNKLFSEHIWKKWEYKKMFTRALNLLKNK